MPRDFFDDWNSFFDNELNRLFKMTSNRFNRPVKDMQPYKFLETENGYIFVTNTLGINKTDISVSVKNEKGDPYPYLHIKGTTKMEKIDFENRVELTIRLILEEKIENVAYDVKDGLTIVYIKVKRDKNDKENVIEAKQVDENFDF
jgi:HSP20 family molecular chaperone IbpA